MQSLGLSQGGLGRGRPQPSSSSTCRVAWDKTLLPQPQSPHWRTRTRAPTRQWCCARQERELEALCERWHTCCHTCDRSPPLWLQHDSHLWSTHRVPRTGTAPNAPLTWGYLTFPEVPQRRYHYHTHFTDEETEAKRKGRDLPRAHGP